MSEHDCHTTNEDHPAKHEDRHTHGECHHHHGPQTPVRGAPGSTYTCPMHPEVEKSEPGTCPFCGMALEPTVPAQGDEENPELVDFQRRLAVGAALTAPVFALAMSGMLPFTDPLAAVPEALSRWLELAFATPVVLWSGLPFFERGWSSLRTRNLNMFTLIAAGVGAAYAFSVAAMLVPAAFPESFRDPNGNVGIYFESAAMIVCLVLLGQILELRARNRTSQAIRALLNLSPETARRILPDGSDEEVPLEAVAVGDRLRIVPGARVPADGVVLEGESAVDESMVSGEPIPRAKREGDELFGSTVNGSGSLVMRVERVGADTLLARIVQMVSDAQRSRAPIQRVADAVAAWFVPAVGVASVLAFIGWAAFGPDPRLAHALVAAVSVLIIACPCALGLATPMSIMVATGRGATAGVLFRDAEAIERFRDIDTLLVDKTGTLTEGRPTLSVVEATGGFSDDEVLRIAASLERGSEHPLASAIVSAAAARDLSLTEAEGFESRAGAGVLGRVEGREILLGNETLLGAHRVDVSSLSIRAASLRARGQTVMLAAIDGRAAGLLGVEDPIKPTTPEALEALRRRGVHVQMLTGDDETTARAVADELGITDVIAGVLPEQKLATVQKLRAAGRVVAMAGDGVNDAPALAEADIGIAMGTGSDVAIESAGVTLVEGDLRALVRAYRLSRATMDNIRQNLFFAFAYNSLGVPIAAGALYPFLGILLSPMVAAAAMSLSSVSVIGNALRLRLARL